MSKLLRTVIAISLSAMLLGCRSVKQSDLIGTWVITEESRQGLPVEVRKVSAKIVLNSNGTFVAYDFPGILEESEDANRLSSGTGNWKIFPMDGDERVQLVFQTATPKPTSLPYGGELFIARPWSTVSLYYTLGDPDNAPRISFEKITNITN